MPDQEKYDIALPRLSPKLGLWLPWLVLAAMLTVTFTLWRSAHHQIERELHAEFEYSVQKAEQDIELRMETYKLLLHGTLGLFASSKEVSREEFRTYFAALDLETRYPGLQAIGFSPLVSADKASSHQKTGATARVLYIEPHSEQNQHTIGYDMYNDPIRRTAMDRARNTGSASLSGKLILQQAVSNNGQPGFVMFLPVQSNTRSADRAPVTIGWVHAQFRARDLMSVLLSTHQPKIDLNIYDGKNTSEQNKLSSRNLLDVKSPPRESRFSVTREIKIAGHSWTLEARSLPRLEARFDRDKPRIILIAGTASSLLLAVMVQLLIHGRTHALRIATEMNSALIKSEYRWKYALESAGEGVWDWDVANDKLFLGPRLRKMLGYDENELMDDFGAWKNLLHPNDRQKIHDSLNAYLQGQALSYETEGRVRCKDGSWKWILTRGTIVSRDPEGLPLRMIGTHADITERHRKDAALHMSAAVFETMNEAVFIVDTNELIVSVNPSFCKITGYTPVEVIGKPPSILSDGSPIAKTLSDMRKSLAHSGTWLGEIVSRRKTGELYVAWMSVSSVRNEQGKVTHHVAAFSDISERKASEQRMQYLAHFDPLTDLPNRALLNDRLRQTLAACRRNHTHMGLLFIDLDKFKPVNDTLGHTVGDILLKEIAYRLLDNIRESDTAARIGGDEFVVLLPGIDSEADAIMVAEKILKAIQEPCELDGHAIQISASIGIAVYPQDGLSDDEMLTHADDAMYHAKHGGGGSIITFRQQHNKMPLST